MPISQAKCRSDMFAEWTPAEAWLAGLLWADGCLTGRRPRGGGMHIMLVSTDRELAEAAAEIAQTNIVVKVDKRANRKPCHTVRFGHPAVIARLELLVAASRLVADLMYADPGPRLTRKAARL